MPQRRRPAVFTILLLSTVIAPAALAQDVPGQTSGVEESFKALPLVLKIGEEVKVTDEAGRATRGKVVSISGDQLVVARRHSQFGYFRPREKRAFAKDAVRSIDLVDSSWNGAGYGAAVGAGFVALSIREFRRSQNNLRGLYIYFLGPIAFASSVGIGRAIDLLINERIYERRAQSPRVMIAPWLRPGAKGFAVQVHF